VLVTVREKRNTGIGRTVGFGKAGGWFVWSCSSGGLRVIMGLEDWMMVEDADDDAPQRGGGGGGEGVEKKSKTTDECGSKASKEQALLTSYQLGPFLLSHRLPQSTNPNSKMSFLISIVHFRDCPVSWNSVTYSAEEMWKVLDDSREQLKGDGFQRTKVCLI
jgi:hypothetical protein